MHPSNGQPESSLCTTASEGLRDLASQREGAIRGPHTRSQTWEAPGIANTDETDHVSHKQSQDLGTVENKDAKGAPSCPSGLSPPILS